MNPRSWPSEHRIALAIATALGAGLGLVIGYAALGDGHTFDHWAWRMPFRNNGLWSGAIGATAGAAVVYLVKLLKH